MSKFKAGTNVFDVCHGWGEVDRIDGGNFFNLPIEVIFDNGHQGQGYYTEEGKMQYSWAGPQLLTEEEAAKLGYYPPKKKVVKTLERWINLYDAANEFVYHSKEEADREAGPDRISCFKVTGTYEVEE